MVNRRLTWLAGIAVLWGAAIFAKLVSLQVLHHREYSRMAKARQELVVEIAAPRGTIFDRNGHPMAMSVPTESVYVNPKKVPDLEVASDLLSRSLHLDRTELYGEMKLAYENRRGFLWIKRRIEPAEAEQLRGMKLDWIGMQKETQRHYPNDRLAAHVLGSVDFEEKGNAGLEKALDADLRGTPGQMRLLTDVKRRGIDSHLDTEARPGMPLTLSIDERVQFVAERQIAAAVTAHGAISGSAVVMNPATGEILALASYPTYDPNVPAKPGDSAARLNHAVSVPFEPGSVFKIITLSAALETTRLTPQSPINCHGGVLKLPGRTIHDSHAGLGVIPMETVLAKSSNIGAIMVGTTVGSQNMYDYVRKFGFNQKTGIELPAESHGRFRKLSQWGTTSLASISMGQEVSVTTVQLAQAVSVIANGGLLVRPHLIIKKGDKAVTLPAAVRVVKPETAITMRQMMEGVVLKGTGSKARLTGYTVGGKTGSAQIFDFASHHYTHSYNGSFVGFAPIANPSIVVAVTINGTHGVEGFGGQSAAPAFQAIATEALRVLEVPKDLPDEEPTLVAQNGDMNDLAAADTDGEVPNILEDLDEEEQAAAAVRLAAGLPTVPNFRGMTMRAVLAEAAQKGLTVQPDGSGIARLQNPPPGSVLHQGERIRVQFAR